MVLHGLVQQVVDLDARGGLSAGPLHAETAVHERVGVGKAVVRSGQHIAPERVVAVVDVKRPEKALAGVHASEVEPIVRRKRELTWRKRIRVLENVRITLP